MRKGISFVKKFISKKVIAITVLVYNFFIGSCIFAGMNWTQATDSAGWAGRGVHTSFIFDNKMWVLGGGNYGGSSIYNDIWCSVDGISWTQVTDSAGWSKRGFHTSVIFDNKMWLLGGTKFDTSLVSYNDVWYSTDGVDWTQATASAGWAIRYGHTSVVFDGKMWVLGGLEPMTGNVYSDVWYSTDGISWTQATASAGWGKKGVHTSVVFDNKMWVLGGIDSTDMACNDVWYSTDGINWTQATASAGWGARDCFASTVFNNKMWVFGGEDYSSNFYNDVWYSTDGANWVQATSSAGWSGRAALTSIVFNNKIWVIGGGGTFGNNDVWYSTGLGVEEQSNLDFGLRNLELKILKNPFANKTTLQYTIPISSRVSVKIYDITGKCVKTLIDGNVSPGSYKETIDSKDYGKGVYFVKFSAGSYKETKKIVVIK
ncbi:MAG: T9SS type A sorting domain-containing protein [bacterium]|nr:T9SS type A sorting domain-containing protein [bacterium]